MQENEHQIWGRKGQRELFVVYIGERSIRTEALTFHTNDAHDERKKKAFLTEVTCRQPFQDLTVIS